MSLTKILLVDDKRENLLALENLISSRDVEVLSALSGNEALALLLDHDFALALLDVQMPHMDGFELARLMRSAERSRGIPIIFVTASQGSKSQIFEGYEKGAVDYLLKPLDPHVVRSKVRTFVELDQKTKKLLEKTNTLQQKLREIEVLHEAAESANRAKSRFLANMSHEIRTPLGAVLGFAELLRSPNQSAEDRQNCVTAIARNGKVLLKIIDDVLDLAKIEAERVEAEQVRVNLSDIIHDIRIVHSYKASEKGILLELSSPTALPEQILSDPLRLKQILNNLLGNAIKFTEKGKVELIVSLEGQAANQRLRFAVKDTGCGLTANGASRLFQPFMQADSSTSRRYGGTGLGLVISKQLAKLLGGDVILAETKPGVGSNFVLTIDPGPLSGEKLVDGPTLLQSQSGDGRSASNERRIRLDGVKILLADDASDNRQLISRLLKLAGASVETAVDGREAIDKALGSHFDIILMDIQMPGTDGYEATHSLRMHGYKRPIIALTAHAMKEELERCLKAGCDFHLSKPIEYQNLLSSIKRFVKEGEELILH